MLQEESYEMTRSSSVRSLESFDEDIEETRLLSRKDEEEEEVWDTFSEDNESISDKSDHSLLRFIAIGISIGLFFFVFKIAMVRLGHNSHHKERGAEKLFYNGTEYFASTVVLISLDGFRSEYFDRDITPNLKRVAKEGVRARAMYPSFPSCTFPNHWSLVTGLYPESHGIVANLFYDSEIGATFEHKNDVIILDRRWWKGQSIWTTAKYNRKLSGSVMWPGAHVQRDGPEYVVRFNSSVTPREKIDTTLSWLDLPYNDRPEIITVYIPEIDQEGHRGGPNGPNINTVIQNIDAEIGYFLDQLKERKIDEHVHVIIVSDHGLAEVNESKVIYYDDILSPDVLEHVQSREAVPLLNLRPKPDAPSDTVQKIYSQLFNYTQSVPEPHFEVYLRENVPSRFHYSHSDRITPIVTIPEVGYTFLTHQETMKTGGNHGYDNMAAEMGAIFIARGPKFNRAYKPGSILAPFFNVEVYGLLTELLNIDAPSNNGTLEGVFSIE